MKVMAMKDQVLIANIPGKAVRTFGKQMPKAYLCLLKKFGNIV